MIWRRIFHNIWWKLGALALSLLLWYAVVGEPEVATTRTVPIVYKNLPRDLLIGSNAVDAVRVELRGPSSRLTSAGLGEVVMTLDLAGVDGPGERSFTLSDADLHLPDDVTFLRSIPSQLRLRFARLKSKEVPVELRFATPLRQGYRIVHQEVTPERLRIAGPENRIDSVTSAQTDSIDLGSFNQTTSIRINAFLSDPQVWLESSPVITVRFAIEKE